MTLEITRHGLFLMIVVGSLVAAIIWFVTTWTAMNLWRAHLHRKMQRSVEVCPLAPPGGDAWRILDAHAELSVAALDVPDAESLQSLNIEAPFGWMRQLISAAQRYKSAVPEQHQQMMREEQERRRGRGSEYIGDTE